MPNTEYDIRSGNEAAAYAVLDAGVNAAYAYPGTPSTEIMERLSSEHKKAFWCANEKTAVEAALGVSFAGGRSFASMKHVGLNVAADPFMSAANLKINGGLVIVVADDPGMHSSQNEQDTRYYADFARLPCFEPSTVQEVYDMTRAGFGLSERQNKIVVVRMVTRLSHSKGRLKRQSPETVPVKKSANSKEWNVVPAFGKLQWQRVLDNWPALEKETEKSPYNVVVALGERSRTERIGVITTGLAREYYLELGKPLPHLHISFYPLPGQKIKNFVSDLSEVYIIEEGYPYLERYLRGIVSPADLKIYGKLDGTFPLAGELNPDIIAKAFAPQADGHFDSAQCPGLPKLENIPVRPPQLCQGCPHSGSFEFIKEAVEGTDVILNADIGCYALGSLPPYSLPLTLVDMGASVAMAKGAADLGKKALAIIGDSTFLHSGVTGLMDCVAANAPVTIIILDNYTTAMTGGQPQLLPSQRLAEIVKAVGVLPENLYELKPLAAEHKHNVEVLKKCLNTPAVSVIITRRECIETLRKRNKAKQAEQKI